LTVELILRTGFDPGIVHGANFGGWSRTKIPGSTWSGRGYSSTGTARSGEPEVTPVMEFLTRVTFLKKVKKGEAVSFLG
jgi:alanine racemase